MGMGFKKNRQKFLLAQIQEKRKEMYLFGRIYGLDAEKTIACSQELDRLLNRYYKLFQTSMDSKSTNIPRKRVRNVFVKKSLLMSAK